MGLSFSPASLASGSVLKIFVFGVNLQGIQLYGISEQLPRMGKALGGRCAAGATSLTWAHHRMAVTKFLRPLGHQRQPFHGLALANAPSLALLPKVLDLR